MKDNYCLGNDRFKIQIEKGILTSLKGMKDPLNVEYIDGKKGFGNLYLTLEKEGQKESFKPFELEGYAEEINWENKEEQCYKGTVIKDDVFIQNSYLVQKHCIKQQVLITNQSEEEICIQDFGLRFAPHTHFQWGQNAGEEVIGKHFISGNGSHSTYYRCNGQGPILLVIPGQDSSFIYYEGENEEGKEVQDKSTMILYGLNEEKGKITEKEGAKLRFGRKRKELRPKERFEFGIEYFLTQDYEDCRTTLVEQRHIVVESIPGYTVPRDMEVRLCLRSKEEDIKVTSLEKAKITWIEKKGEYSFYNIQFEKLGEQTILLEYDHKIMQLHYFITEPISILLKKRAAFITSKQIKEEVWYKGLYAEWNNQTKVLLTPDNYDLIKGWRRYEVTCDDPGLSKPAFLSLKETVDPVQEEVTGLDDYIENFLWGGLQQRDTEPYPYAIYGIPDWKVLRESKELGHKGQTHLWRIYDYPHIALMYYNMYQVAKDYPTIQTRLSKEEYLQRAYGTAHAMFTIPEELIGWSAMKTGLYNECVIPQIVEALKKSGDITKSLRLQNLWRRKIRYFTMECKDVFGSEYPFDTTGFETTYYLADEGLKLTGFKHDESPWSEEIEYVDTLKFMENQMECNVACRGLLEPGYYWYGSDYRGNNMSYLLSYMSQMGGGALLNYACYHSRDPFKLLRLAYGSILSSWALLNSGDEESDYGYWFKGKENDGCASGGFEALYSGTTWLEQPHHGGAWYYSCEIDLGFCGGIRNAATIVAEDPLFGRICYGGRVDEKEGSLSISSLDGVRKRIHYIGTDSRLHIQLVGGQLREERGCVLEMKEGKIVGVNLGLTNFNVSGRILINYLGKETQIEIKPNQSEVRVPFC